MIKVAFLSCVILWISACSDGDASHTASHPQQSLNANSKSGALSCSNTEKLSGQCLYTWNLNNSPLTECVQEYAAAEGRGWYLLSQVTSLTCSTLDYEIETLDGIEALNNLMVVNFSGSEGQLGALRDASGLAALTQLQEVYLEHNRLSSISSLSSMVALKYLNLYANSALDCTEIPALSDKIETVIRPSHCGCALGHVQLGRCSL